MFPTAAPASAQTEASQLIGLLFTVGTAAAAIFVKNANHQKTAGSILAVLEQLLPSIENLI